MKSKNHLFALALLGIIFALGAGLAEGGNRASKPSPPSSGPVVPEYYEDNVYMLLDYTPGEGAILHTAYFSDNLDHVNDRDPDHCLGSVPPWPATSVTAFVVGYDDPGIPEYARAPLVVGKTYYWCIDEFDGTDTWPGSAWGFTVVPQHASNPTPADGAVAVDADPGVTLSWDYMDLDPARYVVKYDVYYGTSLEAVEAGTAEKVQTEQQTSVTVGPLAENTVYYWRVDVLATQFIPPFGQDLFTGNIWRFNTGPELPPDERQASDPSPADGSAIGPEHWEDNIYVVLDYTPGQGAYTHTAYFSDNFDDVSNRNPAHCLGSVPPWPAVYPHVFVVGYNDPVIPEYARTPLVPGQTYYWCIDEFDGENTWPGDVWSFTVMPEQAWNPTPGDGAVDVEPYPDVILSWELGDIDTDGNVLTYDVYYGTDFGAVEAGTAEKVSVNATSLGAASLTIGPLAGDTLHYWRVDTVLRWDRPPFYETVYTGDIWQFTTGKEPPINLS